MPAGILDLVVMSMSKVFFCSFIIFLTHENMGIDTEIEFLTYFVFVLQTIYWYQIMAAAAIWDFKVMWISKVDFYSFIVFLTHENMGLDTEIESLTCLVLILQPIYWYQIMAAAAILDFKVMWISKVDFYSFIVFLTHENMGLDTAIESLTCLVFIL